ncbi:hypothetical protein [Paraflavitalea speifideaquila]|uniref:hypothetical protein n=1 Tax=Paraflavitalea speifideaquila TaxID=3076558 RepID=UPI0028E788A3|nr:hypothetical protein [Paraflavitalea speifideiaquila]
MITSKGYSKDPSIQPDGIVLTLPVAFFEDRGMTTEEFKPMFERYMRQEDAIWNFKLTNLPLHDVAFVYLVFDKQIQYRCQFIMYERNVSKEFYDAPDGQVRSFPPTNWVLFTGPVVKPPYEWPQKGFQGFRYSTKLF